jgi:hypothetical protein
MLRRSSSVRLLCITISPAPGHPGAFSCKARPGGWVFELKPLTGGGAFEIKDLEVLRSPIT